MLFSFFLLLVLNFNELSSQEQVEKGFSSNQVASLPQLFEAKGKINFALPNLNFTAQFEAKIVGEDSAVISIFGPMGVLLAKVFSNNEYFAYYDVLNNWAVVGVPSREKIYQASRVPLSFLDFIRLFKGQFLYPTDSMKNTKMDAEKILYSVKTTDFVDFFLCDGNAKIIQYQKKNTEDKIILNILYPEYFANDTLLLPKKYILQIEERKGTVGLEIENLNWDVDLTRPFSFAIPKSVEIFKYE